MASFNEKDASAYCNVSINVGASVKDVSRNGTTVTFKYNPYFYTSSQYWTSNSVCLWVDGTMYKNFWSYGGSQHTSGGTTYYSAWVDKTVKNVGISSSSLNVDVGVNGNWWDPSSYGPAGYVTLTLSDIPTVSAPTLSNISTSSVTDSSLYASFTVTDSHYQTPNNPAIKVSTTSNMSNVVKTLYARSGTITGLDANRTYYVRGQDANDAGTGYTNVATIQTTFNNPGNPGKPTLLYNTTELTPSSILSASWTAATAGSTPVAGYRLRLYKNGIMTGSVIDTNNTSTAYTFGKLEDLGFVPGDTVQVSIFAYCLDWNNAKHFSGGGSTAIFSDTMTVLSDKYIYVSENGGTFAKHKMYISVNGAAFAEVKKEKFKIIT